MTTKTNPGNFFEDFRMGQEILHATPRTVTDGDVALYTGALRHRASPSTRRPSSPARSGLPRAPLDDLLAFHLVFGKTVPDISLNAVANLGYAQGRFLAPVYPGDTLSTTSTVIGLRQNKDGKIRRRLRPLGRRQPARRDGARLLPLGDGAQAATRPRRRRSRCVPNLPRRSTPPTWWCRRNLDARATTTPTLAGSPHLWDDYAVGEKIDHVDGMTIEEAEHMIATRLYQNTAKVHFDALMQKDEPLRPPADLRRPHHQPRPLALLQRSGQRLQGRRDQRRPARRARPSPATPSTPGRRCWRSWSCPAAPTSARCGCARSRPRTSRAPTSRSRTPTATTTRRSCSISTTRC